MAHLAASVEANGVGSLKVKDGEIFMFSEHCLQKLIEQARTNPEGTVLVFVKNGGNLQENLV